MQLPEVQLHDCEAWKKLWHCQSCLRGPQPLHAHSVQLYRECHRGCSRECSNSERSIRSLTLSRSPKDNARRRLGADRGGAKALGSHVELARLSLRSLLYLPSMF